MMGNSFTSSVSRMLQQHAQQRISRQLSKADALGLAYLRCFAAREFERGSPGAGSAAVRLTTNIVPSPDESRDYRNSSPFPIALGHSVTRFSAKFDASFSCRTYLRPFLFRK